MIGLIKSANDVARININGRPGGKSDWQLHTSCTLRTKSTSEHLFWCFRLSQIEDSIQYLEGPHSSWKDHDHDDRNLSWSFQVPFGPSRY